MRREMSVFAETTDVAIRGDERSGRVGELSRNHAAGKTAKTTEKHENTQQTQAKTNTTAVSDDKKAQKPFTPTINNTHTSMASTPVTHTHTHTHITRNTHNNRGGKEGRRRGGKKELAQRRKEIFLSFFLCFILPRSALLLRFSTIRTSTSTTHIIQKRGRKGGVETDEQRAAHEKTIHRAKKNTQTSRPTCTHHHTINRQAGNTAHDKQTVPGDSLSLVPCRCFTRVHTAHPLHPHDLKNKPEHAPA